MKISKKVKIVLGSILGIFLLLFIVLVVHIATAKPIVYDNATMQISRIDFNEPIDSLKAKEIHRNMKSIAGVKNDKMNLESGVLVYWHDNRVVDSKGVYASLMSKGKYDAKRFEISKEMAAKEACPVMDKNSFSYKFSRGVQRIFN